MELIEKKSRWFWLGSLREWHWISSAICLVGMLLFAVTGILLNHASQISATPQVITHEAQVPAALINAMDRPTQGNAALPSALRDWLAHTPRIVVGEQLAEWSADDVYLALPRPGGDAWLSIDLVTGELIYEKTDRGWIAFFNDLHKGRNTGVAWNWFIDAFAVCCIIFSITGLLLLQRYASARPATWPLVGFGLVFPWLLILLVMH